MEYEVYTKNTVRIQKGLQQFLDEGTPIGQCYVSTQEWHFYRSTRQMVLQEQTTRVQMYWAASPSVGDV